MNITNQFGIASNKEFNYKMARIIFLKWMLVLSGFFNLNTEEKEAVMTPYFKIIDSEIVISGTSNIRDWEVTTSSISEVGSKESIMTLFSNYPEKKALLDQALSGFYLRIPVEKLDSGIRIMNEKMREHLRSKMHPEIGYEILSVKEATFSTGEEECYQITFSGSADAAGVYHQMENDVSLCTFYPNNRDDSKRTKIHVFGTFEIKMTDFGITPPTFMQGALTTGDIIQVDFDFLLTPPHNLD